jgi:sugar lactone lactonase YvrE
LPTDAPNHTHPPNATPTEPARTLLAGLVVGESPRWHEGRLWFANWGAQEVIAVDPNGQSEVALQVPTTLPFCIDWLPDGRLLIVSGPEGVVLRREPDGALVTHADLRGLSPYPWNEIVVDGRGSIYVNGAGFDLMGGGQPAPGRIALITPDGTVAEVADGIAFPNGMAITPDNETLIVADSYGKGLIAFDIAGDGSLSNRRVWAALDGHPDGICIDAAGAVWYADVPGRCCVRVRQGGEVLERVELDRGGFACMLGGVDGKTLFIVAAEWNGPDAMTGGARTGQLLACPAPAAGAGWP